ncbi:MAG: branched-chain amino acid ABC transporter substrate-binding protein [Mobiluncus sp.]|uniref:branched-chain amino acid ABC transporter substrate-binding protein n=1 Tax=Mobiluncus sp. TaxID=47293 RepID=UPI00258F58FB|nr:branched-chain amino acid ABC transporter substrate-binding protein [Mobiluncus sp.]MCI6585303.1 branched-chain amino acid ABC transporter substrate-binding protein [Mobiluncus sp.]
MSALRKLAAGAAALGLSTLMAGTAFASAGQWTGSQQHYNVYSTYPNVVSEQAFMPPTYVDRFDMVTSVTATVTAYNQPNTEQVRLCYTQPYAYSIIACTRYENISGQRIINGMGNFYAVDANGNNETGGLYQNLSAKGNFTVQHRFPDGLQQSLLGDTGRDSIVVNYATD